VFQSRAPRLASGGQDAFGGFDYVDWRNDPCGGVRRIASDRADAGCCGERERSAAHIGPAGAAAHADADKSGSRTGAGTRACSGPAAGGAAL